MRRREFRIAESMFTELLDDTEALTERVEKLMNGDDVDESMDVDDQADTADEVI